MEFKPKFNIGDVVTNEELYNEFKCGNAGGMRSSKTTKTLVLVLDHTKALYDDKWDKDILYYTGMGKVGDQELSRANKTLAESNENGYGVHLFEVFKAKEYQYRGKVKLAADPIQEFQQDEKKEKRKVWIFPLQTIEAGIADAVDVIEVEKKKERQAHGLSQDRLEKLVHENEATAGSCRLVKSKTYVRNQYVAEYTKRRANGKCELCGQKAPFLDAAGEPYLESHHIDWLSQGGLDSIGNTVALCPNCHRKMHIVGDEKDIAQLKELRKKVK